MSDDERTEGKSPAEAVPGERLEDVLASIRALVTAETSSRLGMGDNTVLMLTPDMRLPDEDEAERPGEVLAEGIGLDAEGGSGGSPVLEGAPILDEEAIRDVVNRIVREELQGELGERIGRNLRKLIRREIAQVLAERQTGEG